MTVGKTTIAEFRRRLGEPTKQIEAASNTLWLYYIDTGPVPGEVEVIASSKTRLIDTVVVYPSRLTMSEAVQLFGRRYRIARFDLDLCLSDGDGAPAFESPTGVAERIIYDAKGLALTRERNLVKSIAYLARPYGTKKSRCVQRERDTGLKPQ